MSDHSFTDIQLTAIHAIVLIENKMVPKCGECGYDANRQKCAMDYGGGCPRHVQEDLVNFNTVISQIARRADLPDSWRRFYPLHLVHTLSDEEKGAALDLFDQFQKGETFEKRVCPEVYFKLSKKKVVSISSQYNKTKVVFTDRGLSWVKILVEGEQ